MSVELTPSSKSAFIAGASLSVIAWISMFKLDELAKLFRVNRWIRKQVILEWIDENKSLALLLTEFINFGVHGVTNSESVTFAVGSTVTNALMIFVFLPLRMMKIKRKVGPVVIKRPFVKVGAA